MAPDMALLPIARVAYASCNSRRVTLGWSTSVRADAHTAVHVREPDCQHKHLHTGDLLVRHGARHDWRLQVGIAGCQVVDRIFTLFIIRC